MTTVNFEVGSTTNQMVIDWARDRGIIGSATALDQVCKTIEELGELAGAVCKGDREGQIDAIGDVWVTLILVNEIMGLGDLPMEFGEWNDHHTEKGLIAGISNIVGQLADMIDSLVNVPGSRIENSRLHPRDDMIIDALAALRKLALMLGHDMQSCLDHAYGIISKRKGKMVDGVFVKAAE